MMIFLAEDYSGLRTGSDSAGMIEHLSVWGGVPIKKNFEAEGDTRSGRYPDSSGF
jgi:hypothetical protein